MPSDVYEKPTYENNKASELDRQKREREQFFEGSELAKKDLVNLANEQGKDPIEIEEKLKALEEIQKQQLKNLLDEQQRRMDELEILHNGPPLER
jgi:hypothetical protein